MSPLLTFFIGFQVMAYVFAAIFSVGISIRCWGTHQNHANIALSLAIITLALRRIQTLFGSYLVDLYPKYPTALTNDTIYVQTFLSLCFLYASIRIYASLPKRVKV